MPQYRVWIGSAGPFLVDSESAYGDGVPFGPIRIEEVGGLGKQDNDVLITDEYGVLRFSGVPAGSASWDSISDKPSTFPPSEHTHGTDSLQNQSDLPGASVSQALNGVQDTLAFHIPLIVVPVGGIYLMRGDSLSPVDVLGYGDWEAIKEITDDLDEQIVFWLRRPD